LFEICDESVLSFLDSKMIAGKSKGHSYIIEAKMSSLHSVNLEAEVSSQFFLAKAGFKYLL
jgi:hypothetical protein